MIAATPEAAALPSPRRRPRPSRSWRIYHRAEIARMAGWRDRIDRTTNWAITVIAAMLSVSLSTPTAHHGVLLFAMLLVMLLLGIEARRYRFFDVYRTRVRQLERHYYAEVFAPGACRSRLDPAARRDLRHPVFHIGLREAFGRRLRRNYGWMFAILLLAWVLKITSARLQETGTQAGVAETVTASRRSWPGRPRAAAGLAGARGVAGVYVWLLAAGLRGGPARPG